MLNALTVDVEDYFQVSGFESVVRFEDWDNYECRVVTNTRKILDLFQEHKVTATFFILGWVAERYPAIVKEIHSMGHEIGCHSYAHRLVYTMSQAEFRDDVKKAKSILEEIINEEIVGFRAPSYSIVEDTLWAFDILIELGFKYDSSIFPIRHDRYGMRKYFRFLHTIDRGDMGKIIEFPMSTARCAGMQIPVAGGGYLRLFPYWLTSWGIKRINQVEGQPAIFYFHSWESDESQPKIKGSFLSRYRHYVNIDTTEKKVSRLLEAFEFDTVKKVVGLV